MRTPLLSLLSLLLVGALGAQDTDPLARASELYAQDSFEKAFTLVTESVPEGSTNVALKTRAADVLVTMAGQEYTAKNYKNAYDAYRKALKYAPTNAQASQGFLKIRKEQDVNNLKNEGPPRKAVATEASGSGPAAPVAAPASAELAQLKAALEDAGVRLKAMESSVSSTSHENDALRSQVDQQLKMLQGFLAQKTTPQATSSAEEKALVAQTVQLLAKLSEKGASPQVVVQSDPAIKSLVSSLEEGKKQAEAQNAFNGLLLLGLLVLVGLLLSVVGFLVWAAVRARRHPAPADSSRVRVVRAQVEGVDSNLGRNDTPLLEARDNSDLGYDGGREFAIQKDLLKAERLARMQQEVHNGTLSWSTIRNYIGDLEVSLRAEILKVVEQKLHEGDLLSSEAVLPVLFPFLADHDLFIKEKAERLARTALEDTRKRSADDGLEEDEDDPLSLKNLLKIPRELQGLLKNNDQSLVTAKLCRSMGITLGLSPSECNLLYKTALAHDCGYLMLDRNELQRIVAQPEISEAEFAFIQSHTIKGLSYFGEIELPEQFKAGILYHHERNDGSGYPDGLKKDAIPLFARIIGVAETFAALISKRAYRDKRDIQHALVIISDGARTKFDAAIVDALTKVAPSLRNNG